MDTLLGKSPSKILLHGPSKLLVDEYLWYSPTIGVVAAYTPTASDVHDHFGVFRGVDQIESFGQATVVSCCTALECAKQNCSIDELKRKFNPAFLGVGQVHFHNFLREGDTFISMGKIVFYKFRQMVVDGNIFRVPKGFDLKTFFKNYTEDDFLTYRLPVEFELVAEINQIVGKAIKHSKFNQ